MKLLELRIAGFGRLRDQTIRFAPGLNVIGGPNEAGKSTLAECIIRLLFGYPEAHFKEPRDRFAPWGRDAQFGATLAYALDDGRELETTREFARDDIVTTTYERSTRRGIREHSGARKASPGQGYLKVSKDVFEAAAVIRATEFAEAVDGDARAQLAERLAALVGSGADSGAADAIARLDEFLSELGRSPTAITRLINKAQAELATANKELKAFETDFARAHEAIAKRATALDQIAQLADKRRSLLSQLGEQQLEDLRARIARAESAQLAVDRAHERLASARSSPDAANERAQAIERAIVDWMAAGATVVAAQDRMSTAKPQREDAQRKFTDALRALGQASAKAADLKSRIDALPDLSRIPAIGLDTLRELETIYDRVGELEAIAHRNETFAGISRQRERRSASPFAALLATVVGVGALAAFAIARIDLLLYVGIAGVVAGLLLLAFRLVGGRQRAAGVSDAERAAAEANAAHEKAAAELAERCRALGCKDVDAVREAHRAQLQASQLKAEAAVAQQAVAQCEEHRTFLNAQLDGFAKLDEAVESARAARDERERSLSALLDESGLPPGEPAQRVAAWRSNPSAGELAAQGQAEVATAERELAQILGTQMLDDLRTEEKRLAAEASAGSDSKVDRAAKIDERAIRDELQRLDGELAERRKEQDRLEGELAAFHRDHPTDKTVFEERVARLTAEEARYQRAKRAAMLAKDKIQRAQEAVHRNFAPRLAAALSSALSSVTEGRYLTAFVDPGTLDVKVTVPETGHDVAASRLSSGTQEQIFLALRAAVAQTLASGERVPLLLDDALPHSDDKRLQAALAQLALMGRDGQQILFFTQRGDVVRSARGLGAHVIELPGPATPARAT